MRLTTRTMIVASVLAMGGLLAATGLAHAGCGGGGGSRRTRTYGRVASSGGGCCGSGCARTNMGVMAMTATTMPAMNMGATAQAAAAPAANPAATAGHYHTCPMHPTVASATPGSCPYCHMVYGLEVLWTGT
jgi:hypothetical protein